MNNMKRLIAVMLVLTLALCFVACADANPSAGSTPTKTQPTSSSTKQTEPSSSSSKPEEPQEPSYIVYVLDQDGKPVANIAILLCDDGMCYNPVVTDETGAAKFYFNGPINGAKSKFYVEESNPNQPYQQPGYTIDPMENVDAQGYVHFEEGNNTLTFTVTAVEG